MTDQTRRYINRELSWLEFNQRVLDEAQDRTIPLLERLKFLAITGSNLDEFFMVRVGGLHILREQGISKQDPAGLSPSEQLEAVDNRVRQMVSDQYSSFLEVEEQLAEKGIKRLQPDQLTDLQGQLAERLFMEDIHPILTPIAVSRDAEFPRLVNHSITICVRLAPDPERQEDGRGEGGQDKPRFAVIPFARLSQRFLTLHSEGGYAYLLVEDAVEHFVHRFFPGETVEECVPFRITLNGDIAVRDDTASDLLTDMLDMLAARKTSDIVRLDIADRVSDETLEFLVESLDVQGAIYRLPGPLALTDFMELTGLPGFDRLRNEPMPPQQPPEIDPTASMFDVISQRDVLLCHPYDSFDPVVRLLNEAADDPDVLAIKQTLYRTSRNSPLAAALARAARNGKYVTAIVELKARFDEARNIEWARKLEQDDVQVIYGVKGLKTHAKICLIVRREPHGIRRYVHFGTGNYNEATARIYSDISLMTCADDFGADATSFFNAVTGYSQPRGFRKLEAAPIGLREKIIELIHTETNRREHGQRAHIAVKVNALVDPLTIEALYAASRAGVTVRLNVRGICCLRPGVEGLSENIEVVSIVDRFLEHARIFYFYHGGDERLFISSADWMPRNLDRRVELLVPIEETAARRRVISILDTYFRDNVKARRLLPDGSYTPIEAGGESQVRAQEVLYREAAQAVHRAESSRRTVFEPHRAAGTSED